MEDVHDGAAVFGDQYDTMRAAGKFSATPCVAEHPPWSDVTPQYDLLIDYLKSVGVDNPSDVAHRLLSDFRTIPDIFFASWLKLTSLVGPRLARVIRSTRALLEIAHLSRAAAHPIMLGDNCVEAFLQAHLGYLPTERLTALYVDSSLRLLSVKIIAEGSAGETQCNVSAVFRWGLDVGAAGFILVHNHPSGDARPSLADRNTTRLLASLGKQVQMEMVRHVIVSRGTVSFIDETT